MQRRKLARAIGLSVLSTLGLMVVFPNGSLAAEFWVGKEGSFLLAAFAGEVEGASTYLVPGLNVSVKCAKGILVKGIFETKVEASREMSYSNCTVLTHQAGEEETPCTVAEPIVTRSVIIPSSHSTKLYVTVVPEGENFAIVKVQGTLCPIVGTYAIKGQLSAEVVTNGKAVNLIVFSKAVSELMKDLFRFGTKSAFWISSNTLELTGEHKGKAFGVV